MPERAEATLTDMSAAGGRGSRCSSSCVKSGRLRCNVTDAQRVCLTVVAVVLAASAITAVAACGSSGSEPIARLPPRPAAVPGAPDGAAQAAPDPRDGEAPPPQDAGPDTSAATQAAALCSAPDLVLCFAFEGALTDGSPNANNPTTNANVSFVPGAVGQAAAFGPTSAVRFAPSPSFEVTTATIEAWVKMAPNPDPTSDGVIFDDDSRASLTILPDGTVLCKPNDAVVSAKILPDVWTHVACVFDGAKAHVYVAGSEVGSGAGVIGSSPTSTAALGGNAPSGEPFVGAIDSFRFFRVARTSAQMAAAAVK